MCSVLGEREIKEICTSLEVKTKAKGNKSTTQKH